MAGIFSPTIALTQPSSHDFPVTVLESSIIKTGRGEKFSHPMSFYGLALRSHRGLEREINLKWVRTLIGNGAGAAPRKFVGSELEL